MLSMTSSIERIDMETWKDIPGYEGFYQASNLGRFRSLDCERTTKNGFQKVHRGHILHTYIANDDYLMINLTDNKGRKAFKAHRIIASLFVPNPLNLQIVNHKNENKHDNRADNLEWCTNRYNLRYGSTQKKRIEKIGWRVRQFTIDGKYIQTFVSMRAASRILGIPMSGIYDNCYGKKKSYKGYIFVKVKE